jgi:hypothetical protein
VISPSQEEITVHINWADVDPTTHDKVNITMTNFDVFCYEARCRNAPTFVLYCCLLHQYRGKDDNDDDDDDGGGISIP